MPLTIMGLSVMLGVSTAPSKVQTTTDRITWGWTMTTRETTMNLLADLPDASRGEVFTDILAQPGCRIERIVSQGQTTPVDRPYVQSHDEWALLLAGAARVEMQGAEIALRPGDHLLIPANTAHRVAFTDPDHPTIWLAVHIGEPVRIDDA